MSPYELSLQRQLYTEFDSTGSDVPLHTERTNRSTNNFSCLNPAKVFNPLALELFFFNFNTPCI